MNTTRRHFFKIIARLPLVAAFAPTTPAPPQPQPPPAPLLLNRFSIAGFQYYDGPALKHRLQPGASCSLTREHNNPHDPFAVEIHQGQAGLRPPLGQQAHPPVAGTRGTADLPGDRGRSRGSGLAAGAGGGVDGGVDGVRLFRRTILRALFYSPLSLLGLHIAKAGATGMDDTVVTVKKCCAVCRYFVPKGNCGSMLDGPAGDYCTHRVFTKGLYLLPDSSRFTTEELNIFRRPGDRCEHFALLERLMTEEARI